MEKALAPVGRFLFSLMLILSGLNHFRYLEATTEYARAAGVPLAGLSVVISGAVLLVGGLCVVLGVFTRVAAAAIAVFLLLAAFLVHDFWTYSDPQQAQLQLTNFFKNLSMAGGAFLLMYFGPGPYSLRSQRSATESERRAFQPPLRQRPQE